MKTFLVFLFLCTAAVGHEWYDKACCDESHCRPVPCKDLIYDPSTKTWLYKGMQFSGTMVRSSQDDRCHVCYSDNRESLSPYCVYLPGSS